MNDIKIKSISPNKSPFAKSIVREWVESFVIALVLAMFIRTFFIQAFKIPSGSMRMTLIEGDRLMVNKLLYGPQIPFGSNRFYPFKIKRLPGFSHPQRGEIIVFNYPLEPNRDFIKRLIAFGGETVEIHDGDVYINGKLIKIPVIKNIFYYNNGPYGEAGKPIKVPQGHVFVLGDNSASSSDSRFWGFVPESHIIGRAEIIYWPINRIKLLR